MKRVLKRPQNFLSNNRFKSTFLTNLICLFKGPTETRPRMISLFFKINTIIVHLAILLWPNMPMNDSFIFKKQKGRPESVSVGSLFETS